MILLPLAATTECVRLVVDYGTFADSPGGPNTHCTSVGYGATAAEALAQRAKEYGLPREQYPRYKGNFLCGIDGYPDSGCGDDPNVPYWSVWIWRGGRWTYSQYGVDTLTVADADHDGHPDPIGFRYQAQGAEVSPRSSPAYPSPTPTRPSPTEHPSSAPPTRAPSQAATTAPATSSGTSARPTRSAGPSAPSAPASTEPVAAPPGIAPPKRHGVPLGAVGGGALALALLGAAAWQFRRAP